LTQRPTLIVDVCVQQTKVDLDANLNLFVPDNPLTDEYVLVSPHRTKRPWLGQTEPPQPSTLPEYDPQCYLCPGNARAGGQQNPVYSHTTTFENDYAAVLPPPGPTAPSAPHPLLQTEPVQGGCDVLIFHPRHDLTLARLATLDIEHIIDEWINVYHKRGMQEGVKYVQIFEVKFELLYSKRFLMHLPQNKGAMMGCSNPHPHGQVWSLSEIPTLPAKKLANLRKYSLSEVAPSGAPRGPKGRPCMLCEYVHFELTVPENEGRIILRNEHFVALVPWWAIWPFEVMLLPYKRHIPSLAHLSDEEKKAFADILGRLTRRYDNLFRCSFAYSMGVHQRPIPPIRDGAPAEDEDEDNVAHLHLNFAPPLLRSASVRKFLVG
jgi:UDPglucose--hexose-1-phosphate uridylyltransferase